MWRWWKTVEIEHCSHLSCWRPVSKIWSSNFPTAASAFSNSSNRMTAFGFSRTLDQIPPLRPHIWRSTEECPNNRCLLVSVGWKGVAISRIRLFADPLNICASCTAVSVFPTPVGPPNKNTPRGLSELSHLLIRVVIVLDSCCMMASWPTIRSTSASYSSCCW